MDHLSADLLSKNLPRDRYGIRVINVYITPNNNKESKHSVMYASAFHICLDSHVFSWKLENVMN